MLCKAMNPFRLAGSLCIQFQHLFIQISAVFLKFKPQLKSPCQYVLLKALPPVCMKYTARGES